VGDRFTGAPPPWRREFAGSKLLPARAWLFSKVPELRGARQRAIPKSGNDLKIVDRSASTFVQQIRQKSGGNMFPPGFTDAPVTIKRPKEAGLL